LEQALSLCESFNYSQEYVARLNTAYDKAKGCQGTNSFYLPSSVRNEVHDVFGRISVIVRSGSATPKEERIRTLVSMARVLGKFESELAKEIDKYNLFSKKKD
jgi:hypothetical protein